MMKPNGVGTWLLKVVVSLVVLAVSGGAGVLWNHEQRIQTNATNGAVLDAKVTATMTAINEKLDTIAASIPKPKPKE